MAMNNSFYIASKNSNPNNLIRNFLKLFIFVTVLIINRSENTKCKMRNKIIEIIITNVILTPPHNNKISNKTSSYYNLAEILFYKFILKAKSEIMYYITSNSELIFNYSNI